MTQNTPPSSSQERASSKEDERVEASMWSELRDAIRGTNADYTKSR